MNARSLGDTDELKNYYEKNARNLITTWGGSLNDYASRTWAGLLNDYYARRWEIYFDAVIGAAEKGIELDKDELKSRLATFEQEWVDSTTPIQIHREVRCWIQLVICWKNTGRGLRNLSKPIFL